MPSSHDQVGCLTTFKNILARLLTFVSSSASMALGNRYVSVSCFLLLIVSSRLLAIDDQQTQLLVVSFDGFAFNYLNRSLTPNLKKLFDNADYSGSMLNVFPTQTFANHFSIVTGAYVEDHGVVASEFLDPDTGVVTSYGYKMFHYNPKITPLWTLNEMHSHHSGCMMWPGCNMDYHGINATYSVDFNTSIPWKDRIKTSISWFANRNKRANLIFLYFESPDHEAHTYGPNGKATINGIIKTDEAVAEILNTLRANHLEKVNLVLLSDHGMEAVTMPRIINLTDVIGNLGTAVGSSPVLQIFPKKDKLNELYTRLKQFAAKNGHFAVYKNNEIPDEYYYKHSKRAPPILIVADCKYGFQDLYKTIEADVRFNNISVTNETEFGLHGYPPATVSSMLPFLIARGPDLKNHFKNQPIRSVDLYGIFSDILKLKDEKRLIKKNVFVASVPWKLDFPWLASWLGLLFLFGLFVFSFKRRAGDDNGYLLVSEEETSA